MKRRIESLIGFAISGIDGEIGKVKEFYFDDMSWTIRYMIVETGSWLFGRKVLLSPLTVVKIDWEKETFEVNLTMEQIKNSPLIDTDKPVSRQHEIELYAYYPWGNYYWGSGLWAGGMGTSGMMTSASIPFEAAIHENVDGKEADNPHLRSTDKVTGYNIKATDGEIGDVEDFIIDESTWKIDFMLVDTGNWFPGKKVLISPEWIKEVNWETATVIVDASEEQVKNSPEYQNSEQLSEMYENNLRDYYDGVYLT